MERFLVRSPPCKAAAGREERDTTEPKAEGNGCTEEDHRREEKRPRLEASHPEDPGLARSPWKQIRAEGLSCDYMILFGRSEADRIFQELETEVEYSEGEEAPGPSFATCHP